MSVGTAIVSRLWFQFKGVLHIGTPQAPDPAVLRRVGEVTGLAGGKVRLRWASGDVELVRPQVCPLFRPVNHAGSRNM